MKRLLTYFAILMLALCGQELQGRSYYNSASNLFGGLNAHPGMRMAGRYKAIVDDRLVEENATMGTALTIDTLRVGPGSAYRYQLRIANLNNKQGKTVSVKNPMNGEKIAVTSPQWGLVFNHDSDGNYCAVMLSCDNSAPYNDITDERTMQVAIVQRDGDEVRQLAQTVIARGVALEDGMNTVCVDVDERHVVVSIGKDELQQVTEASVMRPSGAVGVGYLVGAGARVAIERAVLTTAGEQQEAATTLWSIDDLDDYLQHSADPLEGYWHYLDRDMQDEWLRMGGRYTLAIVRADDGYDLIYIDGAQVKKSLWHSGMLKGHMGKTAFVGNYDLRWIDATMEAIDDDAYATIENGIVLTLSFPVFKSQIRFSKVENNP